jgi:sugar/nucleoside kinase (ribokinase family)
MIACIGGAHLDRHGVLHGPLVLGTSNPGAVHVAMGGVARNVAENLARLGERVTLVSRVGDDLAGRQVREHAAGCGWKGLSVEGLAALPVHPKNVTGAGDALVAGTLFGIVRGNSMLESARLGLAAAAITIESPQAAASELTVKMLYERYGGFEP